MGKIIKENKLNKNKYGIIYEGKIEGHLINFIKTEVYRVKTCTPCHNPNHDFEIGGSLSKKEINFIKSDKRNCCTKFLVLDKDEKTEEDIKRLNDILPTNYVLIISKPCIEVVLYGMFNVTEANLSNKVIEEKLCKELHKKYNFVYKHNEESIIKIIEILREDKELLNKWLKNISKLNEIGHSNFYYLIQYFEKISEEENNNGKN